LFKLLASLAKVAGIRDCLLARGLRRLGHRENVGDLGGDPAKIENKLPVFDRHARHLADDAGDGGDGRLILARGRNGDGVLAVVELDALVVLAVPGQRVLAGLGLAIERADDVAGRVPDGDDRLLRRGGQRVGVARAAILQDARTSCRSPSGCGGQRWRRSWK
jgi:hypothetical protein